MARDRLSEEYEHGVADVLANLAGHAAEVERDVRLPGRDSGVARQLDVVVRGTIFGMTNAVLVEDCKRWNKKVGTNEGGLVEQLQRCEGFV